MRGAKLSLSRWSRLLPGRRLQRLWVRGGHLVLPTGVMRADLFIERGRIALIGEAPLDADEPTVDAGGLLVLPGLINAHDHLELNDLPRLGDPGGYENAYQWGLDITQRRRSPIIDRVLAIPLRDRLLAGAYKNLMAGVTTVCHHGEYHRHFDRGFPVRVLKRYRWCHSLGFGDDVVGSYRRTPPDVPWIIHLAEGTDEVARAELGRLEAMGCLGPNTIIVHGVALSDADIESMARRRAGLIWCPASNLFLFGRTAPIARLHGRVLIALGSDSRLSGSAHLLEELKIARSLGAVDDEALFHMVTRDAARLLRIEHEAGTIEPGKRADLLILEGDPRHPYEALVSAHPAAIHLVLIAGRPAYGRIAFRELFRLSGRPFGSIQLAGHPFLVVGDPAIAQQSVSRLHQAEEVAYVTHAPRSARPQGDQATARL